MGFFKKTKLVAIDEASYLKEFMAILKRIDADLAREQSMLKLKFRLLLRFDELMHLHDRPFVNPDERTGIRYTFMEHAESRLVPVLEQIEAIIESQGAVINDATASEKAEEKVETSYGRKLTKREIKILKKLLGILKAQHETVADAIVALGEEFEPAKGYASRYYWYVDKRLRRLHNQFNKERKLFSEELWMERLIEKYAAKFG